MQLRKLWIAVVPLVGLALVQTALADNVFVTTQSRPKIGRVVTISRDKITLETQGGIRTEIPVNEITWIDFMEDPSELREAKQLVRREESYERALLLLEKIKDEKLVRRESDEDRTFYTALCKARLAIGGKGDVTEAGKEMMTFISKSAQSIHYYEAYQVVGDSLIAAGKPDAAIAYGYAKVQQAPFEDYKARANLAAGNAYLADNKPKQALTLFDQVIAAASTGAEGESQKVEATLGKAKASAAGDKAAAANAAKEVEAIIQKAPERDQLLHAKAYNALGSCYSQAGDVKAAALAYLHVDLLYSTYPTEHAEALCGLQKLWGQMGQTARANGAARKIQTNYPNYRCGN